ncbi:MULTISPECIES: hypothetical protein [Streptomycetaceae]|uniref:hypothetical protein n=1 Tax=Streptomycetaceae TaxID=2062 RepID=UPI0004BD1B8E|nr:MULTISPECIES: hypothetical protein [Streptomycetaceae]KOG76950.1 hypothetical protein ADK33_32575 [Streptomyces griseus subsp. rhodochrous]KUJ64235.1 hypothetical protein ACZ90_59375 [Streptomyces albus subsp. albus]
MTILSHSETRPVALPPAVPTDYVFGASDTNDVLGGEDVHAVVTLKVAMTRDMLAAAFDLAMRGAYDENIDELPVQEIRHRVELSLHMESPWDLLRDGANFSDLLYDESVAEQIRAEYRAIDRAYPHMAPKENI